jgi:hypothetical protein
VRLLFLKDDERIHRIKHELPLPSLVVFDRREIQSAMDITAIISELSAERDKLQQAINALNELPEQRRSGEGGSQGA